MPNITLPYKFEPREYQLPVMEALDSGYRRAVWVAHRRSGKDKTLINYVAKSMWERKGSYFYIFPTYKQAKKTIWYGMDRGGFKFTDHFPRELRKRTDNGEMLIEYTNGSIFQLVGSDNIDSLMGTNPVGCVFSEWSLQNPAAWDYLRPILAENGGWAAFIYTPRGKNHGFTTLQTARAYPDTWYSAVSTVEDTKAIDWAVLAQEREEMLRKDSTGALYEQEYMCSFEVPIQGSYFGTQMMEAEKAGRITSVPYDMNTFVNTAWDLGMDDSMTIWFYQVVGQEIRFIDYLSGSGEGINYYIQELIKKNYVYGDHYAPHDIAVRELGTGKSRLEVAKSLGINFRVVPRLDIHDGIQAVRNILNRCWFDKVKCEKGIDCLHSYHKEWDEDNQVFKNKPEHDWASHGADSFRYFAVAHKDIINSGQSVVRNKINDDPYYR